jgi:hypothetical protein
MINIIIKTVRLFGWFSGYKMKNKNEFRNVYLD